MKEFRCLICNMMINEKNFNINEKAFLNKNNKENILCCPFCGASNSYFYDESEVDKLYEEELDVDTIKILENAMKLEVFNGDFYKEASKLATDEENKRKFLDLSKVEYIHARVHKSLGKFSELPTLNKLDYTKYESDELLLDIARKREEHAVAFYEKNVKNISNERIIKVLRALSEVEKEHIVLTSLKK